MNNDIRFIIVTLELEKETKNMVRYRAPGDEDASSRANVPLQYIRKTALASAFGKFPAKLKLTIEEEV